MGGLHRFDDGFDMRQERGSGRGQIDAFALAPEERDPGIEFELLDTAAERGLRDKQLSRSPPEMTLPRQQEE
ncbi:hypothetical protein PBT88_10895 [Sphingomonas abietis]|uniref:Cold-shock protein n=1 Tax=Sphingomonas abietis TaxID=3012344 RepID=A0ABY7NJF0_9SPHN|nr:hypothetical protein [Sphingomonas abietis]WBO20722.1 hypothetical protein PBT88_10895 [Sphingomonas abietis]